MLDVIVREIIKGEQPPVQNDELFNLTVEEWAGAIGYDAAELARQLTKQGITSQQLKLWQAARKDLTDEIIRTRFERFNTGEYSPTKP